MSRPYKVRLRPLINPSRLLGRLSPSSCSSAAAAAAAAAARPAGRDTPPGWGAPGRASAPAPRPAPALGPPRPSIGAPSPAPHRAHAASRPRGADEVEERREGPGRLAQEAAGRPAGRRSGCAGPRGLACACWHGLRCAAEGARFGVLGGCDCVVEGACPAGRPGMGKNKSTASKNGADPEKESPRR